MPLNTFAVSTNTASFVQGKRDVLGSIPASLRAQLTEYLCLRKYAKRFKEALQGTNQTRIFTNMPVKEEVKKLQLIHINEIFGKNGVTTEQESTTIDAAVAHQQHHSSTGPLPTASLKSEQLRIAPYKPPPEGSTTTKPALAFINSKRASNKTKSGSLSTTGYSSAPPRTPSKNAPSAPYTPPNLVWPTDQNVGGREEKKKGGLRNIFKRSNKSKEDKTNVVSAGQNSESPDSTTSSTRTSRLASYKKNSNSNGKGKKKRFGSREKEAVQESSLLPEGDAGSEEDDLFHHRPQYSHPDGLSKMPSPAESTAASTDSMPAHLLYQLQKAKEIEEARKKDNGEWDSDSSTEDLFPSRSGPSIASDSSTTNEHKIPHYREMEEQDVQEKDYHDEENPSRKETGEEEEEEEEESRRKRQGKRKKEGSKRGRQIKTEKKHREREKKSDTNDSDEKRFNGILYGGFSLAATAPPDLMDSLSPSRDRREWKRTPDFDFPPRASGQKRNDQYTAMNRNVTFSDDVTSARSAVPKAKKIKELTISQEDGERLNNKKHKKTKESSKSKEGKKDRKLPNGAALLSSEEREQEEHIEPHGIAHTDMQGKKKKKKTDDEPAVF